MKNKLLFVLLLSSTLTYAAPPVEEGKSIFTTRCAGCHNVNKQVLGPALAGVDQRRSTEWIINFVHSSQAMIQKGDKEAVALFKQYNNIPMPDHKDLSDENIKSVVEYIKTEAGSAEKKAPGGIEEKPLKRTALQTIVESTGWLFTFSTLALLLMAVLLFALKVKQYQRQVAAEK
jgi:cytochrome c551/c552